MDILNNYFATKHEKYFLLILIIDSVMKIVGLAAIDFLNKCTFYLLLILVMASFIRYTSRFHIAISLLVYLPTYFLTWAFDIEGGMLCLILAINGISIATLFLFGKIRKVHPKGPYGIGFRQFIIKKETTPTVSVFYPIKKEEYDRNLSNFDEHVQWWTSDTIGADVMAAWYKPFTPLLLYELLAYKIVALPDREIHPDFKNGNKSLTPVINCHGLGGSRHKQSGVMLNLVSYGCIVYSIDFTDGTWAAFMNHQTVPPSLTAFEVFDESKHKVQAKTFRSNQIDHRMKNLGHLLNKIKEEAKNESYSIDLKKLVALGHSFGGMTAIEMCRCYPEDFALWCSLDPYLISHYDKILADSNYVINQPLMILNSETFHGDRDSGLIDFDSWKVVNKLFEDVKTHNKVDKNYNITIKGTAHGNMSDTSLYLAKYSFTEVLHPNNSKPEDIYQKFIDIVTAFLNEHSYLPVQDKTIK